MIVAQTSPGISAIPGRQGSNRASEARAIPWQRRFWAVSDARRPHSPSSRPRRSAPRVPRAGHLAEDIVPRQAVEPIDGVEDVAAFALGNRLARIVHGRVPGDHRCEADFDVSFHATGQGFDFSSESIVEMEGRGKRGEDSANDAPSQAHPGIAGKQASDAARRSRASESSSAVPGTEARPIASARTDRTRRSASRRGRGICHQ